MGRKWNRFVDKIRPILLYGIPLFLGYILFLMAKKYTRSAGVGTWWCVHAGIPYKIKIPDFSKSKYYHKTSAKWSGYQGQMASLDDTLLIETADLFKKKYGWMLRDQQANLLLSFVQQNVQYNYDKNIYKTPIQISDVWQFPATTIRDARGDCEDSAILYASIAHMIGLDVILIGQPGHMTVGYHATIGVGGSVIRNGKRYYIMETTSMIAFPGIGNGGTDGRMFDIEPMGDEYKEQTYSILPSDMLNTKYKSYEWYCPFHPDMHEDTDYGNCPKCPVCNKQMRLRP